jgi:hypothetical protein
MDLLWRTPDTHRRRPQALIEAAVDERTRKRP